MKGSPETAELFSSVSLLILQRANLQVTGEEGRWAL
jgi:hypothetical protein